MADTVLQLDGVVKEFGETVRTRVLHGIDLEIQGGEFLALTGPSGSGKSTLLNIMGLLDRSTEGTVRILGQDVAKLDDNNLARLRGRTLGFVFQFHHLLPAFSARENVAMPMLLDRNRLDREMLEHADALLEQVGLADRRAYPASKLSGGQQQRVAIARALVLQPSLVLADEPTGNLDTETADQIFDLLRRLNQEFGMAFVVVTHDPRLADRCDRIIRVVDGLIASDQSGDPQGPCRACGYGPCLRHSCMLSADIPKQPSA